MAHRDLRGGWKALLLAAGWLLVSLGCTQGPAPVADAMPPLPDGMDPAPDPSLILAPAIAHIPPGGRLVLGAWGPEAVNALAGSVDGVPGGNSSTGTLLVQGRSLTYQAPAQAGSHAVRIEVQGRPGTAAVARVEVRSTLVPPPASSRVFQVKEAPYLAKGDGVTDDTDALQRALDAADGTGGTVLVPAGTYLVQADRNHTGGIYGLRLRSHQTLRLDPKAILKAIPNDAPVSAVLMAADVEDVRVVGGTLEGERASHQGTGGEWGMGLFVRRVRNLVVEDVTARECWGDGFYVDLSEDIVLHRVVADHNRRQGLTIDSVGAMKVLNSTFRNTAGTAPESGIDVEPDSGRIVTGPVLIAGCTLAANAGRGLLITVPSSQLGSSQVSNVVVVGCTVQRNGNGSVYGTPLCGFTANNVQQVAFVGNTVSGNAGEGVKLTGGAGRGLKVMANLVRDNGSHGILVADVTGSAVRANRLQGNGGMPIRDLQTTGNTIQENEIQ